MAVLSLKFKTWLIFAELHCIVGDCIMSGGQVWQHFFHGGYSNSFYWPRGNNDNFL